MEFLRRIYRILGGKWCFVLGFVLLCATYEYGRVLHLRPLPMHAWRQGDCLSLTWHYYTGEATFGAPRIHARIADGGTSGKSAGEFPLLYWTMGQVWKITGPSEFVYRVFGLIFHFLASYLLFLTLRKLLRSDFWAIGVTLLWFTSPVMLYYSIAFLTDVPAFDLALIGWYFFVRHAEEGKRRWWVFAMMTFALATLLKVTAGMSMVALLGLFLLATIRPRSFGALRRAFPSPLFGWGVVALALACIMAWYVHAEQYNDEHWGRYTFNNLWPLWEMDPEEVERALDYGKHLLLFQVFDTSVLLLLVCALVVVLLHARQIPWPVTLLVGGLIIGTAIYVLFWFHAVDGHDYYFINPTIALLVPLVVWLWWLRERHPDLFHARWARVAFLLLLGYNVAYARNNLIMRSNPASYMDVDDLLPTYHCYEPGYWNSLVYPLWEDLWDIAPYLTSIGIGPDDPIMSLDDFTINTSLYLMQRPGFSQYGYDMDDPATIRRCLELGAKYMVFREDKWLTKDHLQPYLTNLIGQHGKVRVYDLREHRARADTAFVFRQSEGSVIPVKHRSNAAVCPDGQDWCFPGDTFPFEIDGLPLEAPGLLFAEVEVRGTVQRAGSDQGAVILAFAENDSAGQLAQEYRYLPEGPFAASFRVPARSPGVTRKLYLWNKTASPFRLEGLEIVVRHHLPEDLSEPM